MSKDTLTYQPEAMVHPLIKGTYQGRPIKKCLVCFGFFEKDHRYAGGTVFKYNPKFQALTLQRCPKCNPPEKDL